MVRQPAETRLPAAKSGEGLQLVARARPDCVVLDIALPDQDGLTTYQQLRRIDARIPVIFITGHGTTESAIEAMKLGAFEYLLKPLELAQLREVVVNAFTISRLMQVPVVVAEDEPAEATSDVLV